MINIFKNQNASAKNDQHALAKITPLIFWADHRFAHVLELLPEDEAAQAVVELPLALILLQVERGQVSARIPDRDQELRRNVVGASWWVSAVFL